MKKVTLAAILLVSLSFTAMQTTDHAEAFQGLHTDVQKGSDSIQKDTLLDDTLVINEEVKSIEKEVIESSTAGRVSWYGGKFHGRKTSSGEKYNMNELTAAHKTLPFGTKVKITNPKNGKEVIVRITDRGPFVPKREFDLSKAAFQEIANLDAGVLNIKYEVL